MKPNLDMELKNLTLESEAKKERFGKLATLLLDQRLKRGVSRKELEESLGSHSMALSRIESPEPCSLVDLQKYFQALNMITKN